jgi:uncharacterized Zn finger protein
MSYYYGWAPRQSVAQRRADAARRIRDAGRRGAPLSPVTVEGRQLARTYWGKAWCDNLERYRDYAHRLERGRSYLRSGSVIDLQITAGRVEAKVCGSTLYDIAIEVAPVTPAAWRALQRDCAGSIGSRVDLLAGELSEAVMARLCADRTGLFPAPASIEFTCSCPDYAIMCKHVAAAMYGVGVRLDQSPDLLFTLRRVSLDDLIAAAVSTRVAAPPKSSRVLATDGLAAMFGIELAVTPPAAVAPKSKRKGTGTGTGKRKGTGTATRKGTGKRTTAAAPSPRRKRSAVRRPSK